MPGQTNERAFETYVEKILREKSGWQADTIAEWNEALALFPARVQNPPKRAAKFAA